MRCSGTACVVRRAIPSLDGDHRDRAVVARRQWRTVAHDGDDAWRLDVPGADDPLTENARWTIEWTDSCSTSNPERWPFDTSTNAPLPTATGPLHMTIGRAFVSACGLATLDIRDGEGESNGVRVRIEPPADGRFRFVTAYEWTLDGAPIDAPLWASRSAAEIWTPCGAQEAEGVRSTTPGKHTIAGRAIVGRGCRRLCWRHQRITDHRRRERRGERLFERDGAAQRGHEVGLQRRIVLAIDGRVRVPCAVRRRAGSPPPLMCGRARPKALAKPFSRSL